MAPSTIQSLDIQSLLAGYRSKSFEPVQVLDHVFQRAQSFADPAVWIDRLGHRELHDQLDAATQRQLSGIAQPLLGIPFAVKDNMDVAGRVTTAGCPAFAYQAGRSAVVIERLQNLGAILVGKVNLDQFATGLTGTRSPYGICRNLFDPRYIAGGSSSGSAIAVAAGLVSFALGTDTAGSGRVPAAFNNLIGLKPSRGVLSTDGIVPACKSLDCASIFSLTCADARLIFKLLADPERPLQNAVGRFRFGVPGEAELRFFGNSSMPRLYDAAIARMRLSGGEPVTIDFGVLARVGALLYGGPWLAERTITPRTLLETRPGDLNSVVRSVLEPGLKITGAQVFEGLGELESYRRQFAAEWKRCDCLLLPTTGTIFSLAEVEADPIRTNSELGYYTNFVNLMEMCAVAVPAGFTDEGLALGVTVMAPSGNDLKLLEIAEKYHRLSGFPLGATMNSQPAVNEVAPRRGAAGSNEILLAVVGAHLTGQPLNVQLTDRGATLERRCRTAAKYRLFALAQTAPAKPGLIRVSEGGAAIEVEVWRMPVESLGSFMVLVGQPLGIGTLELEDGQLVKGFICEPIATAEARDITSFGGWLNYLSSR